MNLRVLILVLFVGGIGCGAKSRPVLTEEKAQELAQRECSLRDYEEAFGPAAKTEMPPQHIPFGSSAMGWVMWQNGPLILYAQVNGQGNVNEGRVILIKGSKAAP